MAIFEGRPDGSDVDEFFHAGRTRPASQSVESCEGGLDVVDFLDDVC